MIFTKMLQKMLKQDLTYELECNIIERPLAKGKNKKVIGKKAKMAKKKRVIKRKLKLKNYKSCLEATQL